MEAYPSSSLIGLSLFVGLATACGTVFLKLYRARMTLIERRRRGLVGIPYIQVTLSTL